MNYAYPAYVNKIANGTLTLHNIAAIAAQYTIARANKCEQCSGYDTDMEFKRCYYSHYTPDNMKTFNVYEKNLVNIRNAV